MTMETFWTIFIKIITLWLVTFSMASANDYYSTNALQLTARQPQSHQLECDYRLIRGMPVNRVEAKLANLVLPLLNNTPYPFAEAQSAILFLIDISNPQRQAVILKNIQQIKQLLDKTGDHHQLGLASFATEFKVLAPLGSAPAEVVTAVESLRATGQATELYRHSLAAIRLLAESSAQRKALFLLSDGEAEDRAYHHTDVVQAANEAKVVIYGLGYAMSVSQSIHLQTLRRLSEETGGVFVQAGADFALPEAFLQSPFSAFDSGGRVRFDLAPAVNAGLTGDQQVQLTWQTETEPLSLEVAVTLTAVTQRGVQPVVPVRSNSPETSPSKRWWWLSLIPVALLLLLVVVLKGRKKPYLEVVDEVDDKKSRYSLIMSTVRIGRHSDNDLCLNNSSVSRHHAVVRRQNDGSFVLMDLGAKNGVYVNGDKQETVNLVNGDLIELGEAQLRFVSR
jgi:hypothetical protein